MPKGSDQHRHSAWRRNERERKMEKTPPRKMSRTEIALAALFTGALLAFGVWAVWNGADPP
jgi:hypothetical protein